MLVGTGRVSWTTSLLLASRPPLSRFRSPTAFDWKIRAMSTTAAAAASSVLVTTTRRSSRRLRGLSALEADDDVPETDAIPLKKPCRSTLAKSVDYLPRTWECALLRDDPTLQYILGVDEAGRGPLAGPVVAAAVWCPTNINGVIDSKKITNESSREALYDTIVASPNVYWAVAIVNAAVIDEINILQATLLGMRMALQALIQSPQSQSLVRAPAASIHVEEATYVVTNASSLPSSLWIPNACHAMVDGNRLPTDLPCAATSIVKGDGSEYSIAAASILAKVTRDRLMLAYDTLYPDYNLAQHKGYPTAAHMAAVHKYGASPIHRRSFAPLKFMEFDQNGKVVGGDDNKQQVAPKKTATRRSKKNQVEEEAS